MMVSNMQDETREANLTGPGSWQPLPGLDLFRFRVYIGIINGKENGNYRDYREFMGLYTGYTGIMENRMETIV